jgi:hypothetical protein
VKASIWAGELQANTLVNVTDNGKMPLAESATQNISGTASQYVSFTWLGGPLTLPPGKYNVRIQHIKNSGFGIFSSVNSICAGMPAALAPILSRYCAGLRGLVL